jgi:hypothetical protein
MIQKTKERNTFRCIIAVAVMLACTAASYAQESGKTGLLVKGHGWYGIDMEKSRPNLKSY